MVAKRAMKISEKLDQLEELLGRKNVAEKLTQEQMEALLEKIEEIRSGDFISNLAEEMEGLERLIELFSSVPEDDGELTPIFAAAATGDIKTFRRLIKSGGGIDSVLPDGTTLLMTATARGQEKVVAELIKSGANVSQARQDGFTALLLACSIGHEDIVRLLLNAGSDVSILYSLLSEHGKIGGCTVLYIAAQLGHNNICQQLLKKRANIDAMNSVGYTPLMAAIKSGHEDVAIILLKAGANPDPEVVATDDIGDIVSFTPLTLAATNEITGIVGELLKRKVNVDKPSGDGWTALKYAAKEGNVEIVKMLLKAGAAVDMADNEGWTPLMGAASEGHNEIVNLLLKAGANPNLQRNSHYEEDEDGRTALMDAAFAGHIEVVAELLKGKANPNVQMTDGRSALLSAIAGGQSQAVDALLKAGADPSLGNEDVTPIELAMALFATDFNSTNAHRKSLLRIIKSLIQAGSRVVGGLFRLVITQGDAVGPAIDELISIGVDPNTRNESGLPVLHFAARFGFGEVIKALLQGNADVMARSALGVLAYDLAVAYGHPDLALVFVEHMNKVVPTVDRQDAQGQTALVQAVLAGDESTVRSILTQGADATRRDLEGRTALSIAVQMKATDIILALRESGAETIETPGLSAVEAMLLAAEQGALGALMKLHDDGVSLEATDERGNTPLLIAAQNSHPGLLRALVAMGANIEHRNTEGNTAYMVAESASRLCIMSALKELGYPG